MKVTATEIAKAFDYKNAASFRGSSAYQRIKTGCLKIKQKERLNTIIELLPEWGVKSPATIIQGDSGSFRLNIIIHDDTYTISCVNDRFKLSNEEDIAISISLPSVLNYLKFFYQKATQDETI